MGREAARLSILTPGLVAIYARGWQVNLQGPQASLPPDLKPLSSAPSPLLVTDPTLHLIRSPWPKTLLRTGLALERELGKGCQAPEGSCQLSTDPGFSLSLLSVPAHAKLTLSTEPSPQRTSLCVGSSHPPSPCTCPGHSGPSPGSSLQAYFPRQPDKHHI